MSDRNAARQLLRDVLEPRMDAVFRAALFADPAMPDDLAQMYEGLVAQHGISVANPRACRVS